MSKIASLKKKATDLEKKSPEKAIAVYVELLTEMEKYPEDMDVALFNRVGDLMLKQGNVGDAVDYYERAVDHYAEGGFFNNAIALCNKILRQSPGRSTVYYKLGKISAEKGFKADAKQNFLEYADRMQKAGRMDEAFRALGEFADLCPDQTDVRLMLADQLLKADKKNEAIEQLQILYEQFESEGNAAEAEAAGKRIKSIDPNADLKSAGGPRSGGKSGDLVFLDLGDTPKAVQARRSIQMKRATAGIPIIEPAVEPPKARTTIPVRPAAEPPQPRTSTPVTPPPEPPTPRTSTAKPAADVPMAPPPPLDIEPPVTASLDPSSDTSTIFGLQSTSLSDIGSTNSSGLELEPTSLLEPTPPGEGLSARGSLDFIMPDGALTPPAEPEKPELLIEEPIEFDIGAAASTNIAEQPPEIPLVDVNLEDVAVTQQPLPAMARPSTLIAAKSVEMLQAVVDGDPDDWGSHRQLAEAMLESGNREGGLRELEVAMLGYERGGDLSSATSVADEIVRIDPSSVKHHQKRVEYAYRSSDRPLLVEAYLALADALFRNGQVDKSRTIYQRVLELSPDDIRAQAALTSMPEAAPEPPPKDRKSMATAKKSPTPPSPARLESVKPTPVGDESFVNLGDWLRDDEGPKDTRMVVAEQEPTGNEEADFADMLRKFKQGVAENVDDEDYQSHYDLGVAYKEMGLVDEAIAEFQKALRGPQNRVRTYEAIGQCFIEKGQFPMAATILSRALGEKGQTDDDLVGVLYLLGRANEALGKHEEAMQFYQRVFIVDISFQDVADRLNALENAAR